MEWTGSDPNQALVLLHRSLAPSPLIAYAPPTFTHFDLKN